MLQSCNSLTIRNATKVESKRGLSETIPGIRPGTLNSRSHLGVRVLGSWLALLPNLSRSLYEDENLVGLVQTCSDCRQKCQSTSKAAKESIAKR